MFTRINLSFSLKYLFSSCTQFPRQLLNRAILFTTHDLDTGTCFPIKTLEVKCSRRIYIGTRLCAVSAGAVINWVARGQRPHSPHRGGKLGVVSLSCGVGSRRLLSPLVLVSAKHPDLSANETGINVCDSSIQQCRPLWVHLKGINLEILEH